MHKKYKINYIISNVLEAADEKLTAGAADFYVVLLDKLINCELSNEIEGTFKLSRQRLIELAKVDKILCFLWLRELCDKEFIKVQKQNNQIVIQKDDLMYKIRLARVYRRYKFIDLTSDVDEEIGHISTGRMPTGHELMARLEMKDLEEVARSLTDDCSLSEISEELLWKAGEKYE